MQMDGLTKKNHGLCKCDCTNIHVCRAMPIKENSVLIFWILFSKTMFFLWDFFFYKWNLFKLFILFHGILLYGTCTFVLFYGLHKIKNKPGSYAWALCTVSLLQCINSCTFIPIIHLVFAIRLAKANRLFQSLGRTVSKALFPTEQVIGTVNAHCACRLLRGDIFHWHKPPMGALFRDGKMKLIQHGSLLSSV